MTGYPMSKIIGQVRLYDWPECDWSYDPHFDVVFVRENTPMYTFLALKLS